MLICEFLNHPIKLREVWDLGIPSKLGNIDVSLGTSVMACYCGKVSYSSDCFYVKQDISFSLV